MSILNNTRKFAQGLLTEKLIDRAGFATVSPELANREKAASEQRNDHGKGNQTNIAETVEFLGALAANAREA